ncbi:hypothetical protein JW796_00500 [Candidatus Dojkabacteria bacterium]|nr:hypothetical protein [Candidatus Dojkabacteria bacterium]
MPRLNRTQQIVAAVIYFIFGVIVLFILIAFILKFFGASETSGIFRGIFNISNFFTEMFRGSYQDIRFGPLTLSIFRFVAMTYYPIFGYLLVLLIAGLFVLNPFKIARNISNAFFRFIELFLITRFLFKALAASSQSSFVAFIYKYTNFIPDALHFIPVIRIGQSDIELSVFLVFGIVLMIDILIWNLFQGILGEKDYE